MQLKEALQRGDISAVEATTSALDRLDEVNPKINAVVDVLRDEALANAQKADERRGKKEPLGPLHGIPVTTKINMDYAGRATTNGVSALEQNIAKEDAPIVANLKNGGAIVIGLTNTPAFSYRWFSNNDIHGATLNPFDPKITPGGSSGGAASAIAAGIGALAHGNDIAGSGGRGYAAPLRRAGGAVVVHGANRGTQGFRPGHQQNGGPSHPESDGYLAGDHPRTGSRSVHRWPGTTRENHPRMA